MVHRCGVILAILLFTASTNTSEPKPLPDDCSIEVDKGNAEIDDGNTLVELTVRPQCSSCNGHVEYWLHYKTKDGSIHFYAKGESWRSRDGSSVDIVSKGFERLCSNRMSGPCTVKAVEIKNKTCYR
jgi:hypothetical protein